VSKSVFSDFSSSLQTFYWYLGCTSEPYKNIRTLYALVGLFLFLLTSRLLFDRWTSQINFPVHVTRRTVRLFVVETDERETRRPVVDSTRPSRRDNQTNVGHVTFYRFTRLSHQTRLKTSRRTSVCSVRRTHVRRLICTVMMIHIINVCTEMIPRALCVRGARIYNNM